MATPSFTLEQVLAAHPSAAKSALEAPSDDALRVPCYCEENVWRLAFRKLHQQQQQRSDGNASTATSNQRYYVLFVSNPKGCVPMFQQVASSQRDKPIFWDYHVILLSTNSNDEDNDGSNIGNPSMIWDIDSHLPCPCPFPRYLKEVFLRHEKWPPEYQPYFRVIDALTFLQHFSSDRSHMFNSETGEWSAPPPEYDCIKVKESDNTLKRYMTISEEEVREGRESGLGENGQVDGNSNIDDDKRTLNPFGQVCSLQQFQERFGG